MTSLPQVHLVDIHGFDVPTGEKDLPPHDPADASQWPESVELDAIHYEVSDPAERAALEQAAISAECDRRDAVDPWVALMVSGALPALSGGAPKPFEPTAEDWADYHGWSEDLDRRRQISDDEVAQLAAHGCI
jgi:hypothetical protein